MPDELKNLSSKVASMKFFPDINKCFLNTSRNLQLAFHVNGAHPVDLVRVTSKHGCAQYFSFTPGYNNSLFELEKMTLCISSIQNVLSVVFLPLSRRSCDWDFHDL